MLIGLDALMNRFATAFERGRVAGSYLFVGPPGVGKAGFAKWLAKLAFCQKTRCDEHGCRHPCGECVHCVQVDAGSHPDLTQVRKPEGKTQIPLDLLIGPVGARMSEGFCHEIHLRPMQATRKVAILHDADALNEEGANCLLKTLEEPPTGVIIILIGVSEQRQLPTIRSRCRTVRFPIPAGETAIRLLRSRLAADDNMESEQIPDDDALLLAVEVAAGDMQVAQRLVSGQSESLRGALQPLLSDRCPDPIKVAKVINQHVKSAGDIAEKKRNAIRDCMTVALQTFRRQLRQQAAQGALDEPTRIRLDRTLRAFREVDRSANPTTLIECYAADLAIVKTGDRGGIG
ncbi:MAG: AAA family ATPase [Planctomycetota bacterium]